MKSAVDLVEVWRGDFLESQHQGHVAIANLRGEIVEGWGDTGRTILPRSSAKIIQALPLVESGAARAAGLGSEHLALAAASHQGAEIHTSPVRAWLAGLGLNAGALRCGPQPPRNAGDRQKLRDAHLPVDRTHNNCSGKHTGFLTLGQHLGAGPDYIDTDNPVQLAVREAFEDVVGETSPGFGIDGCSAPNFACTLAGLARGMARFAAASESGSARDRAAFSILQAMVAHPDLVAGEGRACTRLIRAMAGRAAVKTGAEGVFVAILPDQGLGVALKIADGATRASEVAMAALLIRLGALDARHPEAIDLLRPEIRNHDGLCTGYMCPAAAIAP